jgi:predicted  nucleic acid-binding Zn-ribbon protein
MKVSFYLLIFIVIIACLAMSYKYKQQISEKFADVPAIPIVTNVTYENKSIIIKWNKPDSTEPIINYFIFINKVNSNNESLYMNILSDSTCTNCSYTINNLNLLDDTDYYVSVMAVNKNGAGIPSLPFNFKTPLPTTPSPTTPSPTYTSVPTPTLTLEDSIKMMQNEKKTYLDSELQNMIVRADGIYEVNKKELSYPDTYLNDVKKSINTINDLVKKDLQEYRLNIHMA